MLALYFKRMTNMLYNEWDLGKEKSDAKGKACAYLYLFGILSETEKIIIKKKNGKLIGFAGYTKWNSKKHLIRKKYYNLLYNILLNSPLIKNKQAIHDYNQAYESIPTNLEGYFDGEVSILIVDKDYRNKGYGSELLSKVFELAKKDNMKNVQILTDESCNYKIYKKFHCKKIYEHVVPFGEAGRYEEETYIYEKKLKEGE